MAFKFTRKYKAFVRVRHICMLHKWYSIKGMVMLPLLSSLVLYQNILLMIWQNSYCLFLSKNFTIGIPKIILLIFIVHVGHVHHYLRTSNSLILLL